MQSIPPIFPAGGPLEADALREMLRNAADRVADYLIGLGSNPIYPANPILPAGELVPEEGEELCDIFGDAADWFEENSIHVGHPGYMGHMDSGVALAGIVADFMVSAVNQNLLASELAPGATLLEKKLVNFFAHRAGFPKNSSGIFTTGGTTANLTALLLARDTALRESSASGLSEMPPLCIMASQDAHYSIAKSAAVIGLGSDRVIPIPVAGPQRRMDPSALPAHFAKAIQAGMRPIAVVATAGTTNCGAIDPIAACAEFCEEQGLWLHVDGAYGGPLILHDVEKKRLNGLERANSLTLDPHKWLYAPKSAGILLVREGDNLRCADYEAPYLDRFEETRTALSLSQGRKALDGSRRFDAFKVWMILRNLGLSGIRDLQDSRLELTRWFYKTLSQDAFFKPAHIPDLTVQTFGPRNSSLKNQVAPAHKRIEEGGNHWTSCTVLDGRPYHRAVLLNPSGNESHLMNVLKALKTEHQRLSEHGEGSRALLHSAPRTESKPR